MHRRSTEYEDLFDQAPVIFAALSGPQHRLEAANPAFLEAIGGDRGQTGVPIGELLPELGPQGVLNRLDEVYRTGTAYRARGARLVLGAPGAEREGYFDFTYEPRRDADGAVDGVVVIAVDITAYHHTQILAAEQRVLLEQIARDAPLGEILTGMARAIEEFSPDLIVSVLLADPDGAHLRHGAGPSLPAFYNEAIDGVPIGPNVGSCGTAAYLRAPVIVTDIATDPRWDGYQELAQQAGVAACWSTPIMGVDGQLLGTFAMYHRTPKAPDDKDVALSGAFARIAALAIERRRALEAGQAAQEREKEAREDLAFVLDASTAITREPHYFDCLQCLARLTVPSLAPLCTVHVMEDGHTHRIAVASDGLAGESLLSAPGLSDAIDGAVTRVLASGATETGRIRATGPESRVVDPESRVAGPESRVVGSESRVAGPNGSHSHHGSNSHDGSQGRDGSHGHDGGSVPGGGSGCGGRTGPSNHTSPGGPGDRTAPDGNASRARLDGSSGPDGSYRPGTPPGRSTVTGYVCVPLATRGRTFGVLTLLATDRELDGHVIALAEELARRAASSADNAHQFTDRVRLARELQAGLLPPELPTVPGAELAASYHPAGEGLDVGGDFYDVFPLRDDRWALMIGDVCGRGAAAATTTGMVRHTARAAARLLHDPAAVVAAINDALIEGTSEDTFVSLIYGELRREGGRLVLDMMRAGHVPPLIRRTDGTVEQLAQPGQLLGIAPGIDDSPYRIALSPGDSLVLVTDGITEARDVEGEFFEEQRLADALVAVRGPAPSAAALLESVTAAVTAFAGDATDDDQAALVLTAS
ncbi:GAF domain-containing SpoIIE family protein phosphatase [Streptomyces sp. NPDC001633]|uniref:GAF domain-containing SpoIIE family protein phosphatase n=1 Tax=Streptomyces sp. NPDC001633 TaxID=3364595 RepID=UPI0036A2AF2E